MLQDYCQTFSKSVKVYSPGNLLKTVVMISGEIQVNNTCMD